MEATMCGGGLDRLADKVVYEGCLLQEDWGFVFHAKNNYGYSCICRQFAFLRQQETKIAELLQRPTRLVLTCQGDKQSLKKLIIALNQRHKLPGKKSMAA